MLLAFLGALVIGVSLGLMGSGGSILTVPILVYVLGQDEKTAIAGSLLVVGSISAVGGMQYVGRRMVDWRSVLWFGVPGMMGTYGGAALAKFVSGTVQLVVFDAVMLAAAFFMLRPARPSDGAKKGQAAWKIVLDGLIVGVLTGFVGVGGGFLIVPALVLLGGLSMQLAVGTSLLIIALKSFSGFYKYLDVLEEFDLQLDWSVLGTFVAVGIVGSVFGNHVSRRLNHDVLRRIFAGLLLVVGLAMLVVKIVEFTSGSAGDAESSLPAPHD